MRSVVLSIIILGTSFEIGAVDSAEREFERQAEALGQSISASDSVGSAYCADLRKKAAALKGQPQRRQMARETYRVECLRDGHGSMGTNQSILD
ncbi:MAG: hypothetical protein GY792_02690 [Gammaproteobacteria bacterium]|nr:hypothetical protein [Gammaproteobacteria bacterium]